MLVDTLSIETVLVDIKVPLLRSVLHEIYSTVIYNEGAGVNRHLSSFVRNDNNYGTCFRVLLIT